MVAHQNGSAGDLASFDGKSTDYIYRSGKWESSDHQEEALMLHVLDQTLLGKADMDHQAYSGKHMLFRLISWLTQDPPRLYYPDQRPMLALKMTMAVLFRNI